MAIDTPDKRRSVQGYSNAVIYPVAAGAIDAADRAQVQWLYSGLSYGPPVPPTPPIPVVAGADGVALVGDLISFGSGDPRRLYWRDKPDPWVQIRAFMRQLVQVDDPGEPEWHVNSEYLKAKRAHDVTTVTRLSRKMRRKP